MIRLWLVRAGPIWRAVIAVVVFCLGSTWSAWAEDRYDRGLLWEVSLRGGKNYLFGTIHSEDPRVLRLPEPVTDALAESRHFVMEVVLDSDGLMNIGNRMLYPEGDGLRTALGERLFQRAVEAARQYGMPAEAADRMRPWALAVTLSTPRTETGLVLDRVLQYEAMRKKLPISGLETVDQQMEVFEGLAPQEQIALLRAVLERFSERNDYFERMFQFYLEGDLEGLLRFSNETDDSLPMQLQRKIERRLLIDRNRHMAETLAPLLAEGGTFVAVGALHLPGRDGLLRILDRAGYEISRVY